MTTALSAGRGTAAMRVSVATSMAGKAAEMVTLLLLATVVPRALGPADYGRFAVPLTIVTVGSLAMTLGGPTLMARFVPAAPLAERVGLARSLGARLARGRAAQLVVIGVAAAAAVVIDPARVPPLETALVLGALVLNVAATLGLQVGLGLGRTAAWSARYPLQNAVLIVAVLLLHDAADGTGAIVALVIAGAVALVLAALVVAPYVAADVSPVPVPAGAIRFGALQAAGAALTQLTHRGGVLAVALLAGSSVETGYTALAVGIALGVTYAVLQAFTVSLPHLGSTDDHASTVGAEIGAQPRGAQEAVPVSSPAISGDVHGDRGQQGASATLRRPQERREAHPAAHQGEAVLRRLAGGLLVALVPAAALATVLLDRILPVVFGDGYEGADAAFVPALALMVLAPLGALAVQASALRLQPEVALASGIASAVTFLVVSLVAVPEWGAAGGTGAALAGGVAGALVYLWRLPDAIGPRIATSTGAGVALVLALGALS